MTQDTFVTHLNGVLRYMTATYFNWHAILTFVTFVVAALVLGRIIAYFIRHAVEHIGKQADKSQNLEVVNRLRRYETYLILSSATIRVILVLFALYFWWLFDHSNTPPTAFIGASAVVLLIVSTSVAPIIRDIVAGAGMMAEQWYGIGDYVKIEPFADMQGIVERVSLRSTRIRTLNGEQIWVNNQNIQAIRISPKGTRTLALELFVRNRELGEKLIDQANENLPIGPLLIVTPLRITEEVKVGKSLWHMTAIGETAPGREWLLEKAAVDLIKELDAAADTPTISHGPLARFADSDAEKRFKRTINNARKRPRKKTSK